MARRVLSAWKDVREWEHLLRWKEELGAQEADLKENEDVDVRE